MRLYSVYDVVADTWSPPFLQENDRSADRSFQILLKKNPESAGDMMLFCVAFWDPKNKVEPLTRNFGVAYPVTPSSIMKEMENA